ncbi:hypothetical protein P4644_11250 [Priestia aryabhattai]|uniref:hypothetical protein n=1 Tax=Priestia aryabhattai TaxID=412384 RepID=UPI002E1E7966|nr:hypothetical protein [Priestia aryabhattai]
MDSLKAKEEKIIQTIIMFCFLVSISLITYDKLPFLHFSSYSPSSIFTFFAAFILIILVGYNYQYYDRWFIIFIAISIAHSLISGVYYDDVGSSFQHIVTLGVGVSIFATVRYAFMKKRKNNKLYENILILSLIWPLTLGYLQLLKQFGLGLGFVDHITGFFAQTVYVGRVQLASSEPSWAVMHLLTIGVILLFNAKGRPFLKLMLFGMFFLFLMIFSSFGYGVLLLSFILFGLVTKRYRFKMLILIALSWVIVFFIVPWLLDVFNVQGYYSQRFNYKYLFSQEFLSSDASGFIRIAFPIIGIYQFFHFPFGYGGGFYYVHFNEYLLKHFAYGLQFDEVMLNVTQAGTATARNLFSKILSEEGIVQFVFFILFLKGIYKQCKTGYGKYVFCLALAFLSNFDTYAFVNFWVLMGVVASGYFNDRHAVVEIKKNKKRIVMYGTTK